jgi:hypothetical protein
MTGLYTPPDTVGYNEAQQFIKKVIHLIFVAADLKMT